MLALIVRVRVHTDSARCEDCTSIQKHVAG